MRTVPLVLIAITLAADFFPDSPSPAFLSLSNRLAVIASLFLCGLLFHYSRSSPARGDLTWAVALTVFLLVFIGIFLFMDDDALAESPVDGWMKGDVK